jgi:hypothetical protein
VYADRIESRNFTDPVPKGHSVVQMLFVVAANFNCDFDMSANNISFKLNQEEITEGVMPLTPQVTRVVCRSRQSVTKQCVGMLLRKLCYYGAIRDENVCSHHGHVRLRRRESAEAVVAQRDVRRASQHHNILRAT